MQKMNRAPAADTVAGVVERPQCLDVIKSSLKDLAKKRPIVGRGVRLMGRLHKLVFTRIRDPFWLFNIELTNKCPMRCVMCPRTHGMTRPQGCIDVAIFRTAIDQYCAANPRYRRQDVLWLHHFGESLLHPDFDACIRYAAEKGFRTGLSVNPLVMNRAIAARLVDSGLFLLCVSLDGHDEDSFSRLRGVSDAYGRSVENLERFAELKTKRAAIMRLEVSIINVASNIDAMPGLVKRWHAVPGVDGVRVKPFVRWNGSIAAINQLGPAPNPDRGARKRLKCLRPWMNMTVCWDGDVVPCCYDYNKAYVLGNVAAKSLREIWNDTPMRRLRAELASGNVTNLLCRDCPEQVCDAF